MALFEKKEINSPPVKKSAAREWWDSVLFAVVAATLIRYLFFEAYVIPTPSMENSLMTGDFLFVSKLHYGVRTPKTPLQIPLTHQTIWLTRIPSYLDWIQLPQTRLPGFSEVKHNDVVVFNYPGNANDPTERDEDGNGGFWFHPVDLRTNFIKRCIGLPGDEIEVKNAQAYINGKLAPMPAAMNNEYLIQTKEAVDEQFFQNYAVRSWNNVAPDSSNKNAFRYAIITSPESLNDMKASGYVTNTEQIPMRQKNAGDYGIYTLNPKWNADFFGPLLIPKEGLTVALDSNNVVRYGNVIKYLDHNDSSSVQVSKGTMTMNGKALKSYTFKQNYYFMMGDNRYESADSRFWGFVPADHVVGKAVLIWMSVDPNPKTIWWKIRWNRLFKLIQ